MASPRSVSANPLASSERRYRRSAFNGSKQLAVAQTPARRILLLLILLVLGLIGCLAVIVGVHLQNNDSSLLTPVSDMQPASR